MSAEQLYSKYEYIWAQQHNTMDSLFAYIQKYPFIEMDTYGNITVKNCNDNSLPVFCCHLDTVHEDVPAPELLGHDVLTSFNGQGIGGDDKCGIVACLELLEKVKCKCIFFRDEEVGCKGSAEYDAKSLKDDLFCIEIDRRNACDLITKVYGTKMCSDEFVARVKDALPHCKVAEGAYTDISKLGAAEINMLNISSGYYNPHGSKEYVVLSELQRNIDGLAVLAKSIIENPMKEKEYKRNENSGYYQQTDWWKGKYKRHYSEPPAKEYDLYGNEINGEDDYNALQYGHVPDEPDGFPGDSYGTQTRNPKDYSDKVIAYYAKKSKKASS